MTFPEITRMMLNSMDFFELRRTAARYSVSFQGVRRQKLIRDIERKILAKGNIDQLVPQTLAATSLASQSPEGAMSAKPNLNQPVKPLGTTRINTFSARNTISRVSSR